jgi:hypothetical protein
VLIINLAITMASHIFDVPDVEFNTQEAVEHAYELDDILHHTPLTEAEKSEIPDDLLAAVSKYIIAKCSDTKFAGLNNSTENVLQPQTENSVGPTRIGVNGQANSGTSSLIK